MDEHTRPYVVQSGRYGRMEQGVLTTYGPGETVLLRPDVATRLGTQVMPAPVPAPGEPKYGRAEDAKAEKADPTPRPAVRRKLGSEGL